MPRDRIPLAEIVEVLDDHELRLRVSNNVFEQRNGSPRDRREESAMKTAADVLRIMATYEDKSRAFIAQLMKDYAEGR